MSRNKTIADVDGDSEPSTGAIGTGVVGDAAAVPSAGPPPASFEVAMTELEALVARMESGRLPLEESLAAYQRGVVLVKYCREALGQVAQRVRILEADLLQPFEPLADEREP